MRQKKILIIGMMFFLAIALSLNVSAWSFDYCTPDPCPSGYSTYSTDCSLESDGVSYECERDCRKHVEGQCDDNWGWGYESNSNEEYISGRENGIRVETDLQSSDKCYKYYAEARVGIDDWRPKSYCSEADSFNLKLITPEGRDTWACSDDWYEGVSSLEWTEPERGESGTYRVASADITAYKDSYCSNEHSWDACGITDEDAEITIKWKEADWISPHYKYETERCSGEFECANGDTRCDDYMQQECIDHNWEDRGVEVGECGVECKNEGETRCDDYTPQKCEDYQWEDQEIQEGECGVECTNLGEKRCSSGELLEKCEDYQWKSWETCSYKCKDAQCIECESGDTDCRESDNNVYYTCNRNNEWEKEGIVEGECGVECTNLGETKCSEEDNVVECSNYELVIKEYCEYCKDGECLSQPPEPEVSSLESFFQGIWEWFQKTFS